MQYAKVQKTKLNDIIGDVSLTPEFIRSPESDFTRKRKLDFSTTFNTILTMGGMTLDKELFDLFEGHDSIPSKSAFVQCRDKILPEAFVHVFYAYTQQLRKYKQWRGYHLLAVDGSRINIARDPSDTDSYIRRKKGKGFNALLLSTVYDVLNHHYVDAVIQGHNNQDERGAFIKMMPNFSPKSIVIADRGYESYNVLAHLHEACQNYVIRVKDIHSNGIASKLNLPQGECDEIVTMLITNFQSDEYKKLANHRFSPSIARFDFSSKAHPIYQLTFRIVRLQLEDGSYQCLITNLPANFSSCDLKYLYKLRWGIETSYRELKYSVGLVNLHAKKRTSIIQEIFAKLILHNFSKSIVQNTLFFN